MLYVAEIGRSATGVYLYFPRSAQRVLESCLSLQALYFAEWGLLFKEPLLMKFDPQVPLLTQL